MIKFCKDPETKDCYKINYKGKNIGFINGFIENSIDYSIEFNASTASLLQLFIHEDRRNQKLSYEVIKELIKTLSVKCNKLVIEFPHNDDYWIHLGDKLKEESLITSYEDYKEHLVYNINAFLNH